MKRIARSSFTLLLVLALSGVVYAATPDELSKHATIRRDTFGVPHIIADTEEAAAFANGYAAAEDHGIEIARLFLKAKSREARYFGKGFQETDALTLLLGVHRAAESGFAQSDEWVRAILDGYAAGYNRFVEQHRNDLPDWVEPVTGIDVLAHAMRVINIEFDLDREQIINAKKQAEMRPGSNMFAVNKERSASGHAMLLGNPHLAWVGSQVWHELHISVPGVVDAYGASLIGIPGIEIGFNQRLGWSHTVNEHDSTDVFELTLAPGDPTSYVFGGKPVKFRQREIKFDVVVDNKLREHSETVYETSFGPVIASGNGHAYVIATPSLGAYRAIEQWSLMAKATNLAEFKSTLDIQGISMFNIAYADADGNCFYISNGRFPKRPVGTDWSGIVPAKKTSDLWTAILPPAQLPQLTNPIGGYVHNSNNAPWYASLAAPMDKSQFPPDIFPDDNDLRSQLGLRMIDSDKSLTFDEMLANKLNTGLLAAERLKAPLIEASRAESKSNPLLKQAADVLEQWDNHAARGSRGAVLFIAFADSYLEMTEHPFAQDWSPAHPMDTPKGLGEPKLALEALAAAAQLLQEKYGSIDVPFGDVYRLRQGKLDLPMSGYEDTLGAYRVIYYQRDKDNKMRAFGGDSYIFAVEFADAPRAVSVLPYGESANEDSPHHEDQAALFADGKFKDVWFAEAAIAAHTERSYHP